VTGNAATNPPAKPPQRFRAARRVLYGVAATIHPSKRQRIRYNAHAGLAFHGRMHYTETAARSELFHRKPRRFLGAHSDCSQYAASCAEWAGVTSVTDTDWTGTLAKKGRPVQEHEVKPGHVVFFGVPPYVHMGVMGRNRHVLGFGTQSGPDRNTLAGLIAYFAGVGHPGYAFRDLT
jgi:cell wall-associated NlpC family hydrolase